MPLLLLEIRPALLERLFAHALEGLLLDVEDLDLAVDGALLALMLEGLDLRPDLLFVATVLKFIVFLFVFFLDNARLLPFQLTDSVLRVTLLLDNLVLWDSTLHDGLQRDAEEASQVHEADGELRRDLLVDLLLIELVEILGEVLFELIQRALDLFLLLHHDVGVGQVFRFHPQNRREHLHVLAQLETH